MKKAAHSSLATDFPERIVDQHAETRQELLVNWPQAPGSFDRLAKAQVEAGVWEKVWKKVGYRLLPAYRRKVSKP